MFNLIVGTKKKREPIVPVPAREKELCGLLRFVDHIGDDT
jgi:hypothetical protein